MKTTIDLQQLTSSLTPQVMPSATARSGSSVPRASIVRLGVIVSTVAAVIAIVLSTVWHVPTAAILVSVVIIGFSLSWRATGRPSDDTRH